MMTTAVSPRPLRLWPAYIGTAVLVAGLGLAPVLGAPAGEYAQMAGMGSALALLLWWLFFSRAPWVARLGALAAVAVAVAALRPFMDPSITGGAMGGLQYILTIPAMALGLVAWAVSTRQLHDRARLAALPVVMLLAAGSLLLLRTDGMGGGVLFDVRWRWQPTAEERLLADVTDGAVKDEPAAPAPAVVQPASGPAPPPATDAAAAPDPSAPAAAASEPSPAAAPSRAPEWPGFRGPERNGVVRGVRIATDWAAAPPVELWRQRIGPGWGSFAVDGDLIYTQEQRGDDEIVACYRLSTGEPVWRHRDPVRFYESNAGAGPRGTPTLSGGRVYAMGATGVLNALDAGTGAVIWSRPTATDTKIGVPDWGFSSSPLVIDGVVIVATAGTLAAYDAGSGAPRWVGQQQGFSYSSPHRVTVNGVTQVLMLTAPGVVSVAPADGALLWEHGWEGGSIVQPAVTADGDILISVLGGTGGSGVRRLGVARTAGTWTVQERWTSNGLKPYFNDYVVHRGHAYGFDGSILSSIDLADGTRKWKGGRYGAGQMILLAEQDLLLVVSEEGGLALVAATPDKFTEIARAPAIEGKTWNHPVLVGNTLLVRNGEEMAAFRLVGSK
jgi:outer membrane protein assembly factor BamB